MKVSVVVPIYNTGRPLHRCIESILGQTHQDLEILLIDDGSTDNSLQVMEAYACQHPDLVRVVSQPNQGVANTRNNGINMASGDYVMFVDHDDFIEPDCVETFVTAAEDSGSDIVIGGYRRVSLEGKTVAERRLQPLPWSKYAQICPWAKLYRRNFLLAEDLQFLDHPIGEDFYLNVVAYQKSQQTTIIGYVGYNWLLNPQSISNTVHKKIGPHSDPIPLLDAIISRVGCDSSLDKGLYEYALIKFVVWYLCNAAVNEPSQRLIHVYDSLEGWLAKNFPRHLANPHIGISTPKGELLYICLLVWSYCMAKNMRIARALVRSYGMVRRKNAVDGAFG